MSPGKRIALALPLGVPHLEEVVHGIRLYARQHADWDFVTSPETHSIPVASLPGWAGDGVIAMINSPNDLQIARQLGCPVVNLSGALEDSVVPRVRVDYEAAGRLAAEHLLSRGFERFAFYGLRDIFYSRACQEGFLRTAAGGHGSVYEDESTAGLAKPWAHDHAALDQWVRSLETPVGLMAAHDPRAVMVAQACRRVGLRVPEDVALIGFNNDGQTCEFCDPPLTSVARPGECIGFEAAALLRRLMAGEPPPVSDLVLPPVGVVERASTDTVAIGNNPAFAQAVRFIHEHASQPLPVEEILKQIDKSRRWLETAFRQRLRTTPHAYITGLRVRQAKRLLLEADPAPQKQLAARCGFTSTQQFNQAFQKATGLLPRAFAEAHRQRKAGHAV